jgi:hypothetical protein
MKISNATLTELALSFKDIRNVLKTLTREYFIDAAKEVATEFPMVKVIVCNDTVFVVPNGLMPIMYPLSRSAKARLEERGLPGIFETFLKFQESLLDGCGGDFNGVRAMIYSEIYSYQNKR